MTRRKARVTPPGPDSAGRPGDPLLVRAALSLYPARWRDRYGEEFASLLTDMASTASWPTRAGLIADTARGALDARLNPPGGRIMPDRIRGPVAVTACAVMVFSIAGAGFQKMTEDPAFAAAARKHAAIGAQLGVLRVAAIVAAVAVLAGALPLAWSIIRQATTARRADLIRPLVIPPAAVTSWLAVVVVIARAYHHPQVHSAANIATVAAIALLGLAAAAACAWAMIALLRRADLPARLLRPQVVPMAVLSVCMAVVTGADISWGLSLRAADSSLFYSNNGLVATPTPPSWAGGLAVLAAVTVVTATATVRAARELSRGS